MPIDRCRESAGAPAELALPAGDVTAGVVRVGNTVRRPTGPHSDAVHALLGHLADRGFDGAPRFLGVDDRGREVLSYVDGDVAHRPYPAWVASDELLVGLARLLRAAHDAAAGFVPPDGASFDTEDVAGPDGPAELVGHADVTPENVVVRGGSPVALLDWDMARPTTRAFDVVNTLRHWAPLTDPADRDPVLIGVDPGQRARLFVDAYGMSACDRAGLVPLMELRMHRSYDAMRARAAKRGGPWAQLWERGVGDALLRGAAWVRSESTRLEAALR